MKLYVQKGTRKVRLQAAVPPEIMAAIDDYRFARRAPNRMAR
jgi:hypothetical protein